MTSLSRPVRRETATVYRGRPLVVELHAGYLTLREKGKRHSVTLDYRTVLDLGYKLLAREAQQEKRARKDEARKAARGR